MRRIPDGFSLSMEIVDGEATVGQHSKIARWSAATNDRISQFSPINFAVTQVARSLSCIDFNHHPIRVGIGRWEAEAVWACNKIDADPTSRVAGYCRQYLFGNAMELVMMIVREGAAPSGIGDRAVEVVYGRKSLLERAEGKKFHAIRGSLTSD